MYSKKELGYVKRLDLCISYQFRDIYLAQRISICDLLLKSNKIDLKRLITDKTKWRTQNEFTKKPNVQHKRIRSTSRQAERSNSSLWLVLANRKSVVSHRDNANTNTSYVTHQKLLKLCWKLLSRTPSRPGFAVSVYHLLRSMQNPLIDKPLKWWCQNIFNSILP